MVATVARTIGSTGDHSTISAWESAAPANLTTCLRHLVTSVSGAFTIDEDYTCTGGAVGKILDTDDSTYVVVSVTSGTFSGTITGSTSGQTATISTLTDTGIIWKGECQNQEFTSASSFGSLGGVTSSATCYLHLTAAAGASFIDHADAATNALKYDATKGAAIRCTGTYTNALNVSANYTVIDRLQISATGTAMEALNISGTGVEVKNCIITYGNVGLQYSGAGAKIVENNLFIQDNATTSNAGAIRGTPTGSPAFTAIKNTFIRPTNRTAAGACIDPASTTFTAIGNLIIGFTTPITTTGNTVTASYNGTTAASITGSNNQTSLTATTELEQPNATTGLDARLKVGATCRDAGTATGAASDIIGTPRPQKAGYDIGAWETPYQSPLPFMIQHHGVAL